MSKNDPIEAKGVLSNFPAGRTGSWRAAPFLLAALAACELLLNPDDHAPPETQPVACTPLTCETAGFPCGRMPDGCGATLLCPDACEPPQTCGGGGEPNRCGRKEICGTGGWCWEHPLPQGRNLRAVAQVGAEFWAVGEAGNVLRFDGASWTSHDTGAGQRLVSVWGAAADDVWIAATEAMVHWDGKRYEHLPVAGRADAVWGTASDDVWYAGNLGSVSHFDGLSWSAAQTPASPQQLVSIHGSGRGDVWAVGTNGYAIHFDGTAWTAHPDPTRVNLEAVWAGAPGVAWAVGWGGAIRRWTGEAWEAVPSSVYADLFAIWGTGPADLWALGQEGLLLRWDGRSWSVEPRIEAPNLAFGGMAGSASEAWAVGSRGYMFRFRDGAWRRFSTGHRTTLSAVWGFQDQLWAVGSEEGPVILRREPSGVWSSLETAARQPLRSLHGTSASDVWTVGDGGEALHFDGAAWRRLPLQSTEDLRSVWTSGGLDVWAVGKKGRVARRTVNGWEAESSSTSANLLSVWGQGPSDLWAGGEGALLRRDAAGWGPVDHPVASNRVITTVWWADPSERWVISRSPAQPAERWTGSWEQVPVPSGSEASWIGLRPWGPGPDEIWTPRGYGVPLRWDGQAWLELSLPEDLEVNGIWGNERHVWMVGRAGAVLRKDR